MKKDSLKKKYCTIKSFFKKKFIKNFLLVFVILILLAYMVLYQFILNRLYLKIEIYGKILSKSIANPLYNLDFVTLKNILESYLLNEEIYKIVIIDEFGNKIDINKIGDKNLNLKEYNIDILKNNFKIGKLILYYNLKFYINKFIFYSFVFLLFAIIGFLFFYADIILFVSKYLVTSFDKLIVTINSIIKNDYKSRIDYSTYQLIETRNIALKFNQMADHIEKTINKLNEKRKQLNYTITNFENIVENIPDAIFIYNMDFKLIYVNNKACTLYGYNRNEILKTSILDRSSSEYTEKDFIEKFMFVKETKKELQFEWIARRKNGKTFPVIIRINYIKFNGEDAILSVVTDESEFNKIKKFLIEIENRYKNLFNKLPVGVFYFDKLANIILYNPGLKDIFSFLLNKLSIYEILNDEKIKNKIYELFENEKDVLSFELVYEEDRVERYFKFILSTIKDADGNITGGIGIVNNITGERKLEREYIKASKLESLGILAGGIAHDFNNIFAGIIGNITLAKYLIPDDPELKEVLQDIEDISLKAKSLTNQILTFAKGSTPVKKVIDIIVLVEKVISLLFAGSKVKVVKKFDKDVFNVKADQEQIYNALYNILCNAKEAVDPFKGEVNIEIKNFIKNEDNILSDYKERYDSDYAIDLEDGKYVEIIISDNGEGIDSKYLHKIFDPYFTTKSEGKGIGLSVSYSIIKKHNGYIFCESTKGVGTKFIIYLPVFDIFSEDLFNENNDKIFNENFYKLSGTVLIMDDEIVIRKTLQKMFNLMGVKTYIVEDGKKAVELYKSFINNNKKIDLVILDLTVPGGYGGKEIIKELIEINPDVKAIISSGYSNDDIMGNYKKYGFIDVIKKPYTIQELYNVCKKYLENQEN